MKPSHPSGKGLIHRRKEMGCGIPFVCLSVLFTGLFLSSGCTEPVNQTNIIRTGTPDPALLEDLEYMPSDLLINSTQAPDGVVISNTTVGRIKDGNLLFRGLVTNQRNIPIAGYVIVYIEILEDNGGLYRMSHPLVSPRELGAGSSYQYFYLTTEPVDESVSSYRILVQISRSYPGV